MNKIVATIAVGYKFASIDPVKYARMPLIQGINKL